MATPSSPTPRSPPKRNPRWKTLKARIRLRFPSITLSSIYHRPTTVTTQPRGSVFGGMLPDDPFAPGAVPVFRPRTVSAPTLFDCASDAQALPPTSSTSPLASLDVALSSPLLMPIDWGSEGSARDSTSSTQTFHTTLTSQFDDDDDDDEVLPSPPHCHTSTHALESIFDDDDDEPQFPGAFRSSGDIFRQKTAAAIHPHSLFAARQAYGRRVHPKPLRHAASSPMLPKRCEYQRHVPRNSVATDASRPPSYTSSLAPSYHQ